MMKNQEPDPKPDDDEQTSDEGLDETICSLRLFEIRALVSYHAVILAESEKAALNEVETWQNAWHDTGELVEVSDVEVFDVRPMKSELQDWSDDAHCYTRVAGDAIRAAFDDEENAEACHQGREKRS